MEKKKVCTTIFLVVIMLVIPFTSMVGGTTNDYVSETSKIEQYKKEETSNSFSDLQPEEFTAEMYVRTEQLSEKYGEISAVAEYCEKVDVELAQIGLLYNMICRSADVLIKITGGLLDWIKEHNKDHILDQLWIFIFLNFYMPVFEYQNTHCEGIVSPVTAATPIAQETTINKESSDCNCEIEQQETTNVNPTQTNNKPTQPSQKTSPTKSRTFIFGFRSSIKYKPQRNVQKLTSTIQKALIKIK